jgi:2'-5' RNA ligase
MQIHGVFSDQQELSAVKQLRSRYDPIRAARFPLHVTVSYAPQRSLSELPGLDSSMELTLGGARVWPAPQAGIYLSAMANGEWLDELRTQLADRGSPHYQPHVTLLHHRAVRADHNLDELLAEFGRDWQPVTAKLDSLVAVDHNGVVLERLSLS